MKDNKNIVTPFLSKIAVPEWAVSEIFGEPDPDLLEEEDRKALKSFQSRWTVMDYGASPHFCTPALFYGEQETLSVNVFQVFLPMPNFIKAIWLNAWESLVLCAFIMGCKSAAACLVRMLVLPFWELSDFITPLFRGVETRKGI